jgi:hypothetical protein
LRRKQRLTPTMPERFQGHTMFGTYGTKKNV